ncbi:MULTISPECIES: DNA-3-methyladenine glycosylase [unclassified Crossiella]|uniref:DNA-3-methyladenine glycosylase n=1 Tax=unclassified Crossiella TaxID=2620835 RepID=UPI0020002DB3|nr:MULTISPECIES: DNA-3-methyladenine glycosylase [unclassified Crossiella]MCK2240740.1 DNA-3-methyladenine glycosylase [Crossiella sp. S99.2]MCK2252809.1 DNA-3-methyladenine glycosylase [Crossiella sp. S99.1]
MTTLDLSADPVVTARRLLGCTLTANGVTARITEVEAYWGAADPASHCYRGKTPRNEIMFGPSGRLYVYFVYGMHFCANIVCLTDGDPGAVLLRAAEITGGLDLARANRPTAKSDADLARGPANLCTALGITRGHNGADLGTPGSPVRLTSAPAVPDDLVEAGPRVGVAVAMDIPWRFWLRGEPSVSAYRRGGKRRQPSSTPRIPG